VRKGIKEARVINLQMQGQSAEYEWRSSWCSGSTKNYSLKLLSSTQKIVMVKKSSERCGQLNECKSVFAVDQKSAATRRLDNIF